MWLATVQLSQTNHNSEPLRHLWEPMPRSQYDTVASPTYKSIKLAHVTSSSNIHVQDSTGMQNPIMITSPEINSCLNSLNDS